MAVNVAVPATDNLQLNYNTTYRGTSVVTSETVLRRGGLDQAFGNSGSCYCAGASTLGRGKIGTVRFVVDAACHDGGKSDDTS